MSERVLLRIFCSKSKQPHVVGKVVATEAGLIVNYVSAVDISVKFSRGSPSTMKPSKDTVLVTDAWCKACSKRLPLAINDAAAAAERGDKAMVLEAEGMSIDPVGVLNRGAVRRTR